MNFGRISDSLQIIGNFGVILGLLFVGFQLYQDRELKRAELSFASINSAIDVAIAGIGEDPQQTVAKSVENPESLSNADLFELSRLYRAEFLVSRQIYLMQLFGLFPEGLGERLDDQFLTVPGANYVRSELGNFTLNPAIEEKWMTVLSDPESIHGLRNYLATLRNDGT